MIVCVPVQGIVRLPEMEGYPLGPDRPGVINYALENDNAALLIACYGREGGPVAAKKCVLLLRCAALMTSFVSPIAPMLNVG